MKKLPEGFKGLWIPREVWLAEDLNVTEKCVLMQIHALTSESSGCYASNAYFGQLLQLDIRSARRYLESLRSKGYINIEYKNPTNNTGRVMYTNMSTQIKCVDKSVHATMTETSMHGRTNLSNVVKSNRTKKDKCPEGEAFDIFWKLYPKKIGSKAKIKKKWESMNGERKLIIADLKTRQWGDKKFIPYPATYLNNDRWLDSVESSTNSQRLHNVI